MAPAETVIKTRITCSWTVDVEEARHWGWLACIFPMKSPSPSAPVSTWTANKYFQCWKQKTPWKRSQGRSSLSLSKTGLFSFFKTVNRNGENFHKVFFVFIHQPPRSLLFKLIQEKNEAGTKNPSLSTTRIVEQDAVVEWALLISSAFYLLNHAREWVVSKSNSNRLPISVPLSHFLFVIFDAKAMTSGECSDCASSKLWCFPWISSYRRSSLPMLPKTSIEQSNPAFESPSKDLAA